MEEIAEKLWYQQLDWSMIWVCTLGILAVIMTMFKSISDKNLSGVSNFFLPTWKNIVYHIVTGFLMLSFISEVGVPFVEYFVKIPTEITGGVDHFLAAMSGIGGGFVIAKIIRLFLKLN